MTQRRLAMAVLREWRAEIRRALRDEYVCYVTQTGLQAYLQTPGNLGASIAVRDLDAERSEIVTLSWWTDAEAIRAFAGTDIERARYFPEDDRYLVTRPDRVQHYAVSMAGCTAHAHTQAGAVSSATVGHALC
jgi:heme-degrading monooxygenase HmoA